MGGYSGMGGLGPGSLPSGPPTPRHFLGVITWQIAQNHA